MLAVQKPQWIGKLTNNVVYDRLAPGVRVELDRKNPRNEAGYRASKHHQWLTRQAGYPKLMFHLGRVIALMGESSTWTGFMNKLDRSLPRHRSTLRPFPDGERSK